MNREATLGLDAGDDDRAEKTLELMAAVARLLRRG
jgi:hypothetical protein